MAWQFKLGFENLSPFSLLAAGAHFGGYNPTSFASSQFKPTPKTHFTLVNVGRNGPRIVGSLSQGNEVIFWGRKEIEEIKRTGNRKSEIWIKKSGK
jgi:hypothetical protein